MIVLDIGNEAVKILAGEKRSLQYFDDYDTPENRFAALSGALKELNITADNVILVLPADILKGRIVSETFERENPKRIIDKKEEEKIYQIVLQRAKEEISRIFSHDLGILRKDLRIVNIRTTEMLIDGYEVPTLQKYEGENLIFRLFAYFLSEYHLKEIDWLCQKAGIKNKKIVHAAEGQLSQLSGEADGIFLDVGGETTQIFLTKNGKLQGIGEFGMGGKIFSQTISEKLGLREKDARIFKEKYAKNELTPESSRRLKEMLYFPQRAWFENLKAKLKEIKESGLFPSNIILFGGASLLPEIKEILKEGQWGNIAFSEKRPQVKILKSPQFAPALLISTYYGKKDY